MAAGRGRRRRPSLAFAELCERELETAKAWAYKEMSAEFWLQPDAIAAKRVFENWHRTVNRSRLEPLKKVARTLAKHLAGLLNYFEHRISNAVTEGFNSRIRAIKAAARGFRRFQNYRTRILFFCGKLDLASAVPSGLSH